LLVEEELLPELLDQDLALARVTGAFVVLNGRWGSGGGARTWGLATRELWREFPMPIQAASEEEAERLMGKAEENAALVSGCNVLGLLWTAELSAGKVVAVISNLGCPGSDLAEGNFRWYCRSEPWTQCDLR